MEGVTPTGETKDSEFMFVDREDVIVKKLQSTKEELQAQITYLCKEVDVIWDVLNKVLLTLLPVTFMWIATLIGKLFGSTFVEVIIHTFIHTLHVLMSLPGFAYFWIFTLPFVWMAALLGHVLHTEFFKGFATALVMAFILSLAYIDGMGLANFYQWVIISINMLINTPKGRQFGSEESSTITSESGSQTTVNSSAEGKDNSAQTNIIETITAETSP